ncbi:MAG: DUF1761 domain-containing protein [Albidovulum sp.]|nr:DUF1761 domain-containing protein [Albidovulum sp.]MDE0306400.1 DUF1761 domain-containing protein [Albidovulum sp.]MDE0532212.1 DUF1761 domain-containing protein [Albidovulum sp.]
MDIISIVVAAAGAFVFGAVWYTVMNEKWMAAAGLESADLEPMNYAKFALAFVAAILASGMMEHLFVSSGIGSWHAGLIGGLGIGLFLAAPWMVVNYAFSKRPVSLMVIDGTYSVGGCAVIGLILGIFG